MGCTNSPSAERDLTSRIMAAKIVLVLALSACALADPSYYGYGGYRGYGYGGTAYEYRSPQGLGKREAEPAYGYGGSYQRVTRLDGYDGQFTTYGVRTSGYGASVDEPKFGRLGKRDAEPSYGYGYGRGVAAHPDGLSYTYRSPQGLGKREAEPGYGYGGPGIAYHPYGGASYEYRSPQGLGKREAKPAYGYGGSYQRVTRVDGYDGQLTSYGVRTSGNAGYVDEPRLGRLGKREAEPSYGYYGPAIAAHPYGGSSFTYRSPQGLRGKRETEPSYGGYSFQNVRRVGGYRQYSAYDVRTAGPYAAVGEVRTGYY